MKERVDGTAGTGRGETRNCTKHIQSNRVNRKEQKLADVVYVSRCESGLTVAPLGPGNPMTPG